jgi:energy-coupling factor transporter transmembrane protein EcfT
MKKVFFSLSGIAALIALVICFQNIATSTQVGIFFGGGNQSLFWPLALLFLLGAGSGFFLSLAFTAKEEQPRDVGGEF